MPYKKKKTHNLYLFIICIGIAFTGPFLFNKTKTIATNDDKISSITTNTTFKITTTTEVKKTQTEKDLKGSLEKIIQNYQDIQISVSVINLQNKEKMLLGNPESYTAASTTKVVTAVCYLKKVDEGKLSLDSYLGSMTGKRQLQQMINRSNNDSWEALNQTIGYSYLKTCSKSLGLDSFDIANNTILPSEMAVLLSKLYNYELLTRSSTNLLLSYMQKTNDEKLIPASVPSDYEVYHKYGILGGNYHDIAIIDGLAGKFILAIYTNGSLSTNERMNRRLLLFGELTKTFFANI